MTVAELIEELKKYEPDVEVFYEYDGSETWKALPINFLDYDQDTNSIIFTEG